MSDKVVIVGGGPGGYEAAHVAAQLGAEVTIVDSDGLGGSAVLTDCVPSKTLIATSEVMSEVAEAAELGITFNDPQGDAAGSALVLAQLVAEMLVGAALFQAAMAIYQRYVPDTPEINPDYLANQKDVESQERVLAALMKERRQVTKVVTRLENEREKFVIENATAYIANKARMSIRASY